MTNPKAHRLKEKPSKAFPAPELAMGVTDEPSCISLHLLLAMRVSVLEQLSLPRSAGSLLLSQGGPQTPMSDALGVSPSCCSSPPAYSPCPSQALLLQSSPRRWAKRVLQREPSPTCRGAAKIIAAGTPKHSHCSWRVEQPQNVGCPCSEGSLAVGAWLCRLRSRGPETFGVTCPCAWLM